MKNPLLPLANKYLYTILTFQPMMQLIILIFLYLPYRELWKCFKDFWGRLSVSQIFVIMLSDDIKRSVTFLKTKQQQIIETKTKNYPGCLYVCPSDHLQRYKCNQNNTFVPSGPSADTEIIIFK